jgi:putative flippase GtrA
VFDKKIIRFLIVGLINTLVGYSLYAFFIFIGLSYPIAVLFSTVLGVAFNYKSIGSLVFAHEGESRALPFIGVYVIVYGLNIYGLWQLEVLGIENKYIAGALLLVPLAALSFLLNKYWVFKK